MGHRLSPRVEKAIDYARTRRLHAEYPDRFRKDLPRKKQLRNQQYRKLLDRSLRDQLTRADLEPEDLAPETPRRRKTARFLGGNVPLGESVRQALRHRAYRVGWNLTKRAYDPARHRERAVAFMEGLTAGRTSRLREVALYWQAALEAPPDVQWPWMGVVSVWHPGKRYHPGRACWLQGFLADQPEWEPRLREWVAAVLALPPVGPASWRRPGA
jgi:hypothetical protein